MRELLREYYDGSLSRRGFFRRLVATGLTASAAWSMVEAAELGGMEEQEASGDSHTTFTGTGGELLMEQVKAAGTRFIFSNPGSVEAGFFDALTDRPELQLIMGLHEGIVIPMADGYHKVTGEPALVNVHTAAGTAQMAGQMFNAHRDGSALVVTAGMVDTSIFSDDLGLAPSPGHHQTEINDQFTKISWEIRNPASTAVAMRRAYKVSSTAPGGPVYVALTRAALGEVVTGRVWPKEHFTITARPRPADEEIDALARLFIESKQPVVIYGDEVWKSGAQAEAIELAELLGFPVGSAWQAYTNFPMKHAQFIGRYQGDTAYPYGKADLIVQLGTRDPGSRAVPDRPRTGPGARYVAVGIDTNNLGRTQPMDLALVGDVRETLRGLIDSVKSMATAERLDRIRADRLAVVTPAVAEREAERVRMATANFEKSPIHPDRVDYELEQAADKNAIILEENFTGRHDFLNFGTREDEKLKLTKGGSLGWGVGAAIGAKIGAPDRDVILSIGDGATMYSAAGFWTMARYDVPVLTMVCNNHNYQTVRNAFARFNRRMVKTNQYHGMYLGDPEIDFVGLAASQGVKGRRVTAVADLPGAIKEGLDVTRAGQPYLLEVVIQRMGSGADSTWHHKYSVGAQQMSRA